MITTVFDCVVFVQAAISPSGPAAACLSLAEDGYVALTVSPAVLQEIRETLSKPPLRERFSHLTDERIDQFLQAIFGFAKVREDPPPLASVGRDPDDEPYIHLAAAAGAAFLVSRDKDLLSLMDDEAFRKEFPALSIVDPKTFLDRVRPTIAKDAGEA